MIQTGEYKRVICYDPDMILKRTRGLKIINTYYLLEDINSCSPYKIVSFNKEKQSGGFIVKDKEYGILIKGFELNDSQNGNKYGECLSW